MAALRSTGLDRVVIETVEKNTPLLAICLACSCSPKEVTSRHGVQGLGVIPARCVRLPDTVRVPQLGWNA
jgi:glutamine amidotransferase